MERLKVTPEDALDLLRRSSQQLNISCARWPAASRKPASWGQESRHADQQSGRRPYFLSSTLNTVRRHMSSYS